MNKKSNPFLFWTGSPVPVIAAFLLASLSYGGIIRLDFVEFEKRVFEKYPILREKVLNIEKSQLQLKELELSVLLPRFEVEMAMGPAPGLKTTYDSNFIYRSGTIDYTQWVPQSNRKFDLFDLEGWGPFFGLEGTVAQPLNMGRYRSGHRAAELNIRIAEEEHYKTRMDISLEAQEIYYGYLLSEKMLAETKIAGRDFDKAERKIEDMLDEENESVSQKDLLKLKAGRFSLSKGENEALTGFRRAAMGARFYLDLPDSLAFQPVDTILVKSMIAFPPLDTLKRMMLEQHPDLKRLENGLKAREELINVARGEMGPDLFLFGSIKYAKAWSSQRESGGGDVFTNDPMNELTGVAGLGLKLRLNIWSRYQQIRRQRLELKQLKRTEVYAARGLLLKLEEAWVQYEEARSNMAAAAKSLQAAEGWLKGAAMSYDLDPSQAKEMIDPYKTVLVGKKDFFTSVFQYNLAVGRVIHAAGFTLSDFLNRPMKVSGTSVPDRQY